jgi:hypothetical protein
VPNAALVGPSQWCDCNAFHYDSFGDHLQTCQDKSVVVQVHDWVVYRLGVILGSVGHKVKIHKITPTTGKERGDLEIKNYMVLQKPQEQTDHLPPPRTLIVDFTLTQTQYGRSHVHSIGQLTNTRCSDDAPEPDGDLRVVTRKKILHYHQLYLDRPEPMTFMSAAVDTSDRIYDDFLRLVFLHAHREASDLVDEVPEESGQFRFLLDVCLTILRGQWG